MAKILIAGCGSIGCQLAQALTQQGHQVTAMRRNTQKVPANIQAIAQDLTQPLPKLAQFDYVFYTASAGKYQDLAYYQAYVQGIQNLIQALKTPPLSPPKHLFFTSSTSVFGQNQGEWVTETSNTTENSFATRRLLQGETLLQESGLKTTIIRLGGIYGPGRTHLLDLVSTGKAHCMEGIYSNRIHSEDVVGVLQHLMQLHQKGQTLEPLYIAVDDQPTLICEIYDWLAEQLNVGELERLQPSETSRQLRSNKRLSNAKLKATGYHFQYPNYQAGYKILLSKNDN